MTFLIKNAQIMDGTGKSAVKGDVLVKNDKISAIGNLPKYKADETVDAAGTYLTPGFIDINTDSDHYLTLFSNPEQKDFLLDGATTIVGGHCGVSLAPLIYGSLESLKEWTDINKVNVDWHSFKEFFNAMGRIALGVNFATLVGHTTIRQAISGESFRDLTKNELLVFKTILEKSLKEGAFGFSTGLGYAYGHQTHYSEIKTLAETTAKTNALYSTHLRNEKEGLLFSVSETIHLAKETGVRTLISHFRPFKGLEKDYNDCLELIVKNADKADILFDVCPNDSSVVSACALLPSWLRTADKKIMLQNLKDAEVRKKTVKELPKLKGDEIIIVGAPHHEYLVGKTLKSFSQNRNLALSQGFLKLIEITDARAVIYYKNINIKSVIKALNHEKAIIASNEASPPKKPENNPRIFSKFIELAEENKILPIEKAIYKITGLPAAALGLKNRGLIKEGNFADMVIIKDRKIKDVFLNGKIVVKDGEKQNIRAGKMLKR